MFTVLNSFVISKGKTVLLVFFLEIITSGFPLVFCYIMLLLVLLFTLDPFAII